MCKFRRKMHKSPLVTLLHYNNRILLIRDSNISFVVVFKSTEGLTTQTAVLAEVALP